MCHITPGSSTGSCQPIISPPPAPSDGGVNDSATPVDGPAGSAADSAADSPASQPPTACALYGQSCTASSDCCNGVPCSLGAGGCPAGSTACTCAYLVQ